MIRINSPNPVQDVRIALCNKLFLQSAIVPHLETCEQYMCKYTFLGYTVCLLSCNQDFNYTCVVYKKVFPYCKWAFRMPYSICGVYNAWKKNTVCSHKHNCREISKHYALGFIPLVKSTCSTDMLQFFMHLDLLPEFSDCGSIYLFFKVTLEIKFTQPEVAPQFRLVVCSTIVLTLYWRIMSLVYKGIPG